MVGILICILHLDALCSLELEVSLHEFLLADESEVKGHSDEIALSAVITFIIIAINNVTCSVDQVRGEILESLMIVRVSKDIIGMDTLQVHLLILHPASFDSSQSIPLLGTDTVFP